ncbi:MAG TPA: hypothetical protein VE981_16390 [Planctomycetota bacterium]|nr:hypothetical protein [Planctomycetota bacterium]
MYLRFVYARTRDRQRRRMGILHRRSRGCEDVDAIDDLHLWLTRNLPIPPNDVFSAGRALCWFKVDAHPCIDKVRDLAMLLERGGERIWQVYSRNPGLITYEDEQQVVAVPESIRLTGHA